MRGSISRLLREWVWAAAGLALLGAIPSQAGTLTLDFDLSGSTLMVGNLATVTNGMGAAISGTTRIQLNNVDANGRVSGGMGTAWIFVGPNVNFDINARVRDLDATLVGPLKLTDMVAGVNGIPITSMGRTGSSLADFDGAKLTFLPNGFNTNALGNLSCIGTQCGSAGVMFPIGVDIGWVSNPLGPFSINVGNLGGMATLDTAINFDTAANFVVSGQSVVFNVSLRGRESMRRFVPEPLETGLLVFGAMILVGVRRWRAGLG